MCVSVCVVGRVRHRGAFAVCRLGHKNDTPSQKVAVKSLMRDHPTEKDEFTTVDLCDDDQFPIVGWAQRGAAGPMFAEHGPAAGPLSRRCRGKGQL